MVQLISDLEGEAEFLDENSLERRLFQYMNDLCGEGFKLEAKSQVSGLYLSNKLICRFDENEKTIYFFPGIGAVLNKTLPKEEMRNALLGYKRDFVKQGYKVVSD